MTFHFHLFFRFFVLAYAAVVLAACGKTEALLSADVMKPAPTELVDVLVATLRAPDNDPKVLFSAERSKALSFAEVTVSVPNERKPGSLKFPGRRVDLATDFAAIRVGRMNNQSNFVGRINQQLETRGSGEKRVFVFVHGYNVNFAAGVFRHAQLMKDYQVPGVAVHFSWPSANKLGLYLYDRDSAEFAREGLVKTLDLVRQSNATQIVMLGHSMGGFLVMEALRTASLRGDTALLRSLEATILAAPDIDVDVFNQQLDAIEPMPEPFIVMVSSKDRALQVSQRLRGGTARVGEGTDIEDLQARGITVLDLSKLNGADRLNHSTFASSETLQKLMTGGVLDPLVQGDDSEAAQKALGAGLGGISDVLSDLVYLPARAIGVR
ncbi:MAG: alpha/beta hydrolase [Notoacmeibacter sp.]